MNILKKIIILFPLFILFSCASNRPTGKTDAEVLYKEAKELVEEKRYILAVEKLNAIKSQYPYSFYSTHAELLQADIFFMQENYLEAAAAYILFKDFHPKHKKIPYVIWRIAESFFRQLPDTYDRDLSPAQEGLSYYSLLLRKYPSTSYKKDAMQRINIINEMLRNKDLYIADFYFKTGVYDSAKYRYQRILNSYKNLDIKTLAMLRIVAASLELKDYNSCIQLGTKYIKFVKGATRKKMDSYLSECKSETN